MTNEQKAEHYHQLLLKHDRLDGKVADIKSESAGMTLNSDQESRINALEVEKSKIVAEAQQLFESYTSTRA